MNKLEYLKKLYNYSFTDLEIFTGINSATLCKLAKEIFRFRQSHIDILSSFFNVTSDYLLGKSDTGFNAIINNGGDSITLSEEQYFKYRLKIKEKLIEHEEPTTMVITYRDKIVFSKYTIYRELIENNVKETYVKELNDLVYKMNANELKTTIKFIRKFFDMKE